MLNSAEELKDFLSGEGVILDVRSPSEFLHAHLPDAVSLPLFSDQERATVGTTYKKEGRQAAIELGIKIAGPKAADILAKARSLVQAYGSGKPAARVHCWRGGMRSAAVASLLGAVGIRCITLRGGYKSYRRFCLEQLDCQKPIIILGGLTGSGKTAMLAALKRRGQQVLDLEQLACHRGSAYGALRGICQPSSEQFENDIAWGWSHFDATKPVWIEGESRLIGRCKIPEGLERQMCQAPIILVERPIQERLEIIFRDYSAMDKEYLIEATSRLSKRLGSEAAKNIIDLLESGSFFQDKNKAMELIADTILRYYDKTYLHAIQARHQTVYPIQGAALTDDEWADKLIEKMASLD